MDLSVSVLGESVVSHIRSRQARPLLTIGSDRYTYSKLAAAGCFNYMAAANLSAILNSHFHLKNTRDLFDHVPPDALVLPRLGAVSLAVLGAVFELSKLGGDAPLEAWFQKHGKPVLTFHTIKLKAAHREPPPQKPKKGSGTKHEQNSRTTRQALTAP